MINSIITEEKIRLRYPDLDCDKSVKPFALLNFFQDIASDGAEEAGFGYSHIISKNLLWFLLKYRIEFYEYPSNITELTLKTQPRGYNKIFAYRNFELSANEKIIAKASSIWSLVDFENKKPVNVKDNIDSPYMVKFEQDSDDLQFDKIPPVKEVSFSKTFEVRYNDLDVNGHANNGNYIIWALEPLPYEFRTKYKPQIIDIAFKKESKFEDEIISEIEFDGEKTTLHSLKNIKTGDELCVMKCIWS